MRPAPWEWLALAAGLAVFGYVGWDGALWDARYQLGLHLLAVGAIAVLGIYVVRGGRLPSTPIDLPLLGLLAAFAAATASALNVGISLRAMAAIAAVALMLPVVLITVRHRPTWVGLVAGVPILLLSIPTLVVLVSRRIEWVVAGAPGLPPLRLSSEGTPFGSVAVPPFVIWPAWALAGLIGPRWLRQTVQLGLVIVGIPLTVLSGSRSAWLAIAIGLLAAGIPWAWRRRHQLRVRGGGLSLRGAVIGLAAVGTAAIAAAFVIPRLTAVTSLIYRGSLWRDTLNAWSVDPLLGLGPGIMPFARQAAAPDFTFPVRQPHSHNVPLGVLGDAGLIGLAAGITLLVSIVAVAGPWRCRTAPGRTASFVLVGVAFGSLFEDLTFLPGFNLLVVMLLGMVLLDSGAVRWVSPALAGPPRAAVLAGTAAIGMVLLASMAVADAGAVAYRRGIDAWAEGRASDASDAFAQSVGVDRWQPTGHKALAVAADAAGDGEMAIEAARRATELGPGDGNGWTNLALLCRKIDDTECQLTATNRAVRMTGFFEADLANAALTYESLGRPAEADDAYRRSLLSQRLTAFVLEWPRRIPIGQAEIFDQAGPQFELNLLLAWHAMGEPIDAEVLTDPATRALAHAMRGERAEAEHWLDRAIATAPEGLATWDAAVVLRRHWGGPLEDTLRVATVVRGGRFPDPDAAGHPPGLTFDIGTFRIYPGDGLVRSAQRLQTDPAYPWVLERALP